MDLTLLTHGHQPDSPQPELGLRAKHQRPRVKVHGAWAFGHCLVVGVLDESAKHDSACIIELLSLTIEHATWSNKFWAGQELPTMFSTFGL